MSLCEHHQQQALKQHLHNCAACREYAEQAARVSALIANLQQQIEPANTSNLLMQKVADKTRETTKQTKIAIAGSCVSFFARFNALQIKLIQQPCYRQTSSNSC
jgi:predicted anti-sigma-YlaC factor YlaD